MRGCSARHPHHRGEYLVREETAQAAPASRVGWLIPHRSRTVSSGSMECHRCGPSIRPCAGGDRVARRAPERFPRNRGTSTTHTGSHRAQSATGRTGDGHSGNGWLVSTGAASGSLLPLYRRSDVVALGSTGREAPGGPDGGSDGPRQGDQAQCKIGQEALASGRQMGGRHDARRATGGSQYQNGLRAGLLRGDHDRRRHRIFCWAAQDTAQHLANMQWGAALASQRNHEVRRLFVARVPQDGFDAGASMGCRQSCYICSKTASRFGQRANWMVDKGVLKRHERARVVSVCKDGRPQELDKCRPNSPLTAIDKVYSVIIKELRCGRWLPTYLPDMQYGVRPARRTPQPMCLCV